MFRSVTTMEYRAKQTRSVTFITGQGKIMLEFPTWADNHEHVQRWHQDARNPGRFVVRLKVRPDVNKK
jgi:LEA14-like dessication related protein